VASCATGKSFVQRLLLAALWLVALGSAAPAELRIRGLPGGELGRYLTLFTDIRKSGEHVIIDGPCLSACTLVLSLVPREHICVTPRAVFGFHAAREVDNRSGRSSPATEVTRLMQATYPTTVQAWITRHGGLSRRMLLLRGHELAEMYPKCR
jgi:hypothetical protein